MARTSSDTTAPVIEIPSALMTTASGEYEIVGSVTDESEIAEFRLLGKVIPLLPGGRFRVPAYASLGTSEIEIEAIDVWNNRTTRTVVVTRAAPEERPAVQFSALNPLNVSAPPNPNAVAIVVGLEGYENAPAASYADRDAQVFMDYAQRAFGVPASNIKLLVNDDARIVSMGERSSGPSPSGSRYDEVAVQRVARNNASKSSAGMGFETDVSGRAVGSSSIFRGSSSQISLSSNGSSSSL